MASDSVTVEIDYKAGHSLRQTWDKVDLYCPKCGEQEVWSERGAGDYYQGPTHICTACERRFTIPMLSKVSYTERQAIEATRRARGDGEVGGE